MQKRLSQRDIGLAELSAIAAKKPKRAFSPPGKRRSLLTVISIAIGVFSVVIISAVGKIGTSQVAGTLTSMGLNSVLVQPEVRATLTKSDMDAARRVPGVHEVMPLMTATTQLKIIQKTENCMAWGVSERARQIISLTAAHGRLITDADVAARARVCVIDERIATAAYGRANIVGKKIWLLLGGSYCEFEVAGVAKSGISALQSALSGVIPDFVYVPYTTMQTLVGRTGFDRVAALLDGNADANTVSDTIVRQIERQSRNGGVTIMNLLQQRQGLERVLRTVTLVLSLIAGISLLVSGLSVMTAMLVTVSERRREIGIKKSVGAGRGAILGEFLRESLRLALTGAVFGTGAGLVVTFFGCAATGLGFSFDFEAAGLACAAAVMMGGLFGVYPAFKAANMPPVEALRM